MIKLFKIYGHEVFFLSIIQIIKKNCGAKKIDGSQYYDERTASEITHCL